jgi:hypothetical protein
LDGTVRPLLSKGDETVGGRVCHLNLNTGIHTCQSCRKSN